MGLVTESNPSRRLLAQRAAAFVRCGLKTRGAHQRRRTEMVIWAHRGSRDERDITASHLDGDLSADDREELAGYRSAGAS